MKQRITLVATFADNSLLEINQRLSIFDNSKLCKVPYSKNIEDRKMVDTLPYHITLSAWDRKEKDSICIGLEKIKFASFKIKIVDVNIMSGKENSYVLYWEIESNNVLNELQNEVYRISPSIKYNPQNFKAHITIHIGKDYEKILRMQKDLKENFKEFYLTIRNIKLYEIYPAELVKII